MKTTGKFIEYCEEAVKMEIQPEDSDMESFQKRQNFEYFEEDVKEEIVDEKNFHSKLEKQLWAHTVSEHESPVSLYSM